MLLLDTSGGNYAEISVRKKDALDRTDTKKAMAGIGIENHGRDLKIFDLL